MLEKIPKVESKHHFLSLIARVQLLRQLRSYGLDPKEWRFESLNIFEEQGGNAVISHKKDLNLKIKGRAQKHLIPSATGDFWFWEDLAWDL